MDLPEDKGEAEHLSGEQEELRAVNVSYSYPNKESKAIEDIRFTLAPNETIALVGANGAGKSTLIKVLMGLYKPDTGSVTSGSTDLSHIETGERYNRISAVFQDFSKYGMTVGENISLCEDPDRKRINDLTEDLDLTKLLKNIPEGQILAKDYGGIDLSGGQWQQLAILRGYYKQGQVVFLDEPTSAIDPLTEQKLYDAFRKMLQGKAGVIITHRLSAAALADRIVVMKDGKIAEEGTKEQLLERKGIFRKMWDAQKSLYEEKAISRNAENR